MKPEDFEYMNLHVKKKKICEDLVPAIIHVDKTRPQTVYKEKNNFLYNVQEEFKKITGAGLLINTSFNVHEEPIVESYNDAFKGILNEQKLPSRKIVLKIKIKKYLI